MQTTVIIDRNHIEPQHVAGICAACSGFALARRLTRRVEASDWEAGILRLEKRLNGICLAVLFLFVLYLVPILLSCLTG